MSDFCDPALHAPWAVDPLAVSHHPHRFGRCTMAAALLANDKVGALEGGSVRIWPGVRGFE